MKVDDILPLNEAIVNVPKHWIKDIIDIYRAPLIYAYASEFTDDDDEKMEMLDGLKFAPKGDVDAVKGVYNTPNKLYILRNEMELKDLYDETFIDDTTVTIVAHYAENLSTLGSYSYNTKHGNLIILNLAGFIATGEELDSPTLEINAMLKEMGNVLEHELVHLIQKTQGNQNQLKKNKGYELSSVGRNTEYFKSPVEFNAMITSLIRNLESNLDKLSQEEKTLLGYDNIMNGIKYTLGQENIQYQETGSEQVDSKARQVFNDTFTVSSFMQTLKQEKVNSWKRAVKAILKHFDKKL